MIETAKVGMTLPIEAISIQTQLQRWSRDDDFKLSRRFLPLRLEESYQDP